MPSLFSIFSKKDKKSGDSDVASYVSGVQVGSSDRGYTQLTATTYDSLKISHPEIIIEHAIQHYMPPRFPYYQSIRQKDVDNFRGLWDAIYHNEGMGRAGGNTKLSEFFEVFYYKLFQRSEKFRDYFGNNIKERCRVLTRQLVFFTTLKLTSNIDAVFSDLGKLHQRLGISNWQYAMFVEVLLETISAVLGDEADMLRMQSAAKVISFCLYKLLKNTLIAENVRPMEMNVNFNDTKVERIIGKLEEENTFENTKRIKEVSDRKSASVRSD